MIVSRPFMWRIIVLLCCLVSAQALANNPLQLDKRLTDTQNTTGLTFEQQTNQLQSNIANLAANEAAFLKAQREFELNRQALTKQLTDAQNPLKPSTNADLKQQASMAYLRLSELKETDANLNQQLTNQMLRQKSLPQLVQSAKELLKQQKKTPKAPADSPTGITQELQGALYLQSLQTLESELASSTNRISLTQLQLKLIRQQLFQQEQLIERINSEISIRRQLTTEKALSENLIDTSELTDPLVVQINDANREYGDELKRLTEKTQNTLRLQEKSENLYQQQAKQLTDIQEQISWVKINPAFGEKFLQLLQSLPTPPSQDALQLQINDARLARYHIEQQQNVNQQLLIRDKYNSLQQKLLKSQQVLLSKLLDEYKVYLGELSKLKLSYEQLKQQHANITNLLNEHLFWVPNASPISKLWLFDLHRSTNWLIKQAPWSQVSRAVVEHSDLWSWWIILLVLSLALQDLISPKFKGFLSNYANFVGNVTQDQFSYTFKAISVSLVYSLIWPLPIICAGFFFYWSEHNFVQSTGVAIISAALVYWLYRFYYLLSLPDGILVSHFKKPAFFIVEIRSRVRSLVTQAIPLVAILGFTETLDASLVRNSIGRGAFILLCIVLWRFYKDSLLQSKQFQQRLSTTGKNKTLLQKLFWLMLLAVPFISCVLAIFGYYFTAFQLLMQLQLSLILGLGFMLVYELIRRWMLMERRRIAFDRAKSKRAEKLAQRDKLDAHLSDMVENFEEPQLDLDTISSQSLGLVHSLLLLAFFISLIGLWSQTHTALFSFLDGITMWTSNANINGIEQQIPITLKSVFLGLIIVGVSMMIASNLPGLLELILLQKLDLTPGTGFAITTVTRYLVVMIGTVTGFATLGMEWSKLQWLIAALSVGLGFGLQEIFANFISGLIILFEKPIRIGDTVTIRELTGTVSKIKTRATTIIDWDRKEIIVPNKAFITEQLVNWSLSDPITRVVAFVSVARDSDPAKVEAALYQAVTECPDALSIPEPEVWFAGFGQHTQDYEVRAFAKDMGTRWPLRHSLHKQISKKLKENQLELAYPQLEVHLNPQAKEKAGLLT